MISCSGDVSLSGKAKAEFTNKSACEISPMLMITGNDRAVNGYAINAWLSLFFLMREIIVSENIPTKIKLGHSTAAKLNMWDRPS